MLLKEEKVEAYKLFMAAALTGSVRLLNERDEEADKFRFSAEELAEDANDIATAALEWLEGYEENYEDMMRNKHMLERETRERYEARQAAKK